jgi:lysophospholipase L1-like esterase
MHKKLTAVFLGILSALLALEAGLRILGKIHTPPSHGPEHAEILCLGNSYTAGIGAPPGESYCDHLRDFYNIEGRTSSVRIVNLGRPSLNTSQIVSTLADDIARHSPRIVLVMAGEPNFWNRRGLAEFRSAGSGANRLDRFLEALSQLKVARLFLHLRLQESQTLERRAPHPLFGDLLISTPEEEAHAWVAWIVSSRVSAIAGLSEHEAGEALQSLLQLNDRDPSNAEVRLALARLYLFRKKSPEEALRAYESSIALRPLGFAITALLDLEEAGTSRPSVLSDLHGRLRKQVPGRHLLDLARMLRQPRLSRLRSSNAVLRDHLAKLPPEKRRRFLGNLEHLVNSGFPSAAAVYFLADQKLGERRRDERGAVKLLTEYLQRFPMDSAFDPMVRLTQLRDGHHPNSSQIEESIMTFKQAFPGQVSRFARVEAEEVARWISFDLDRMVRIFRDSSVPFVLMTYPPNVWDLSSRPADHVIRSFALNKNLPLFDTYDQLLDLVSPRNARPIYYASNAAAQDNHLTSAGYKALAERLYRFLKDREFELLPTGSGD